MKQYIVTKDILNIRSSATDVDDSNFIGQLNKGETLYLLDDEIIGVTPNGGTSKIWKSDPLNRLVSLDGVRLKSYADRKAEFLEDPTLEFLHHNSSDESQWSVTWGFVNLEIWKVWETCKTKGAGVKVAVIDTGLNYGLSDFTGSAPITYRNSLNKTDNQADCIDTLGHGTDCAAYLCGRGPSLFGVAPEVELMVVKVADAVGNLPTDAIIQGFKDAIAAGVHLISISLTVDDGDPLMQQLHDQVQTAALKGIVVCSAIGDDPSGGIAEYPATFPEALSVGASTITDARSGASSPSLALKIMAPGDHFPSLSTPGTPSSGSSFGTAIAAGAIALLKAVANSKSIALTNAQIFDILKRSARTDFNNYDTRDFGWGIIDLNAAINLLPTP